MEQKIAYIAIDTSIVGLSTGCVKLMNADGTGSMPLTPYLTAVNRITWTPDSKTIIFNSNDAANEGIFQVSIKDMSVVKLYSAPHGICAFPSLSRDGSMLAFSTFTDSATSKIMLLDMTTGQISQLTIGTSYDSNPSWSTDGSALVYARAEYVRPYNWIGGAIWYIDKNGQNNTQLTPNGYYGPCWQQ